MFTWTLRVTRQFARGLRTSPGGGHPGRRPGRSQIQTNSSRESADPSSGGALPKYFAEAAHVFGQQFLQLRRADVIRILKQKLHDVPVCPATADMRLDAEALDLTQVELTLLAQESAIETVAVLRAPLRPGAAHPRHAQGNGSAVVPFDLDAGFHRAHQLQQAREERALPLDATPRRKTLVAQMPALAVDFPRHDVFRLLLQPPQVDMERGHGLVEKFAEGRDIDLGQPMDHD